jgi:hypothetical protein
VSPKQTTVDLAGLGDELGEVFEAGADVDVNRNPHTFGSADWGCEQGFSGLGEGPRSSR